MITDNKEVIIMSEVTAPIMTDATGQSIDSKLNSLLGKMDDLAAAFQPNASGIVYSNTTSGLTGDDVQEAIDEMAADVSEIKSSLSNLIKSQSFSGNTNNDGNLVFSELSPANIIAIGVVTTDLSRIWRFGVSGSGKLIINFSSTANTALNNQPVSGTLYYIEP